MIDLNSPEDNVVTLSYIQSVLDRFEKTDDVYTPELVCDAVLVLLYDTDRPPSPDDDLSDYLKGHFSGNLIFQKVDAKAEWPEGPYFLRGHELHQIWRLYSDHLGAFVSTVVPDDKGPNT